MDNDKKTIESAIQLADRLERLSADSVWAHRSSGLRGSLLKFLEQIEQKQLDDKNDFTLTDKQLAQINSLLHWGYFMLENAAKEIPIKE